MSDLVAFLRARLDDDEREAREVDSRQPDDWRLETSADSHGRVDLLLIHPARVLAEVAAKRTILDLHAEHAAAYPNECAHCNRNESAWDTIRLLAQPFRDHPDFDPAWTEETR